MSATQVGGRLVWRALLLAIGMGLATRVAWAGQSRPGVPRWPDGAMIRVWIDPQGAPLGARDFVARAVTTWSEAAQGAVTLAVTPVEAAAAVRVSFINDRTRYGETAPRVDGTGGIVSAAVAINAGFFADPLERGLVVYLTALHELGHALGLGHTASFGDIMYAFRAPEDGERYFARFRQRLTTAADIGTARATGLSQDDRAALARLYGR